MSREIIFRGKSVVGMGWMFGYLEYCRKKGGRAIIHCYYKNGRYEGSAAVEYNTVGQFTGLYDKNGKEIYEGDILRWYDNNILYVVTFEHGMFYASIKECNEGMIGGFSLHRLTKYHDRKCEIVGNIHDNPELLKGGEQ